MTRDLTSGKPMRLVIDFAVPTMLGLLFQQFYALVDSVIVGKLLGGDALGAVGSTGPVNFLVIGFCTGLCNGFAIPVAQALGAGDHSKMRRYAIHCGYLAILFATLLTILTTVLCDPILTAMDTPADIYRDAYAYIIVIFIGIPTCFLYNMPAGIIRSLGDSRTPVYFLALASLLNIVLDLVFIILVGTGVEGAAIATVLSQGVSGVICLWYMTKQYPILHSTKEERVPQLRLSADLCQSGLPMGLQYSITAIGSIVLQTAVNGLGTMYVTAVAAAWKVLMLFFTPYDALGATMATYCGQNVGARKLARLGQGIWVSSILGFWYSMAAMVFLAFFAPHVSMLFLQEGADEILALTVNFIQFTSYFLFPLALVNIVRFAIQGMGFSNLAVLAGVTEMVSRFTFGYWLVPNFGFIAAKMASPSAWIAADAFLIPAALWCIWTLRKRLNIPRGSEVDLL